MKRLFKRFSGDQSGTSVIELAFVVPFLALMLTATVDISMGLGFKLKLERSAKAASELALVKRPVNGDVSHITAAAKQVYGNPDITPDVKLTCECPDGSAIACDASCASGRKSSYLTVVLTDSYAPLLGYLGPEAISMTGESVLRLQ